MLMKSANLLLKLLVQPPLLPSSVPDCSADSSLAGQTPCGALGFYNWTMTRMHILLSLPVETLNFTDDYQRHRNVSLTGET